MQSMAVALDCLTKVEEKSLLLDTTHFRHKTQRSELDLARKPPP